MMPTMSTQVRPILVVDDQERLVKALVTILCHAGYEVITATTGRAALERAQAELPGLVLCDMSMPDMSGMEVCKTLRANPMTAQMPFVLMSGCDPELNGLRPDAFLHKPFKPVEVLRAIGEFTKTVKLLATK
jgi:CheY-like chemotaxis protein